MTKIHDIAKATGYSVTTVSKALNNYTDISDKARKKILDTANKMGYIPNAQARGLVMKRSFTIGVILDEMLDLGLTHPFFSGVIQAFRKAVEANGYSMILISNNIANSQVESYLKHCHQRNVDAVFILCTDKNDPSIQELIHSKFPTVLFDIPDEESNAVISDHYRGALEAVKYLVEQGHRKIAHIYGSELTFAGAERQRGFNDAVEDLGLEIQDDYKVSGGYFDFKYGKRAMDELLQLEDRPTAVFISGDMMALGAVQSCHERGVRIPEDISIIGFDNLKLLDWITPSLTTVAQDYDAIGHACCEILIDIIKSKTDKKVHRTIPVHIIERSSCAAAS